MRQLYHSIHTAFPKRLLLFSALFLLLLGGRAVFAAESPLVTTVEELNAALAGAADGDTILVGDIAFRPMPAGMIVVSKNVTIRSGLSSNAVFTNATFTLNGTETASAPLAVRFENIDFRGDRAGMPADGNASSVSTELPGILHTMCATIFHRNVDASYTGCTFDGYHYGYGGVFSAVYSSPDTKSCKLQLTLDRCSFRNSAAKYGGCLYLSAYDRNIRLDARRCVFEGNAAGAGGAVWAQHSDLLFTDCSFTGNRSLAPLIDTPDGGALALYACGTELDGCRIADNVSAGSGAGIFCEISPFRTLVMENCTVTGSSAPGDEGICLAASDTKYDTAPAAHIAFSSLFGTQSFGGMENLFGCLLVEADAAGDEPRPENGYCLVLTPERARDMGLSTEPSGHISLPGGDYPIPWEAIEALSGGKFANSPGRLAVGDQYVPEAVFTFRTAPGRIETRTVPYGEEIPLPSAERRGYSFSGWEFPGGTLLQSGTVFRGGALPVGIITGRWHFLLKENLPVLLMPAAALAVLAVLVFRRKKRIVIPDAADAPDVLTSEIAEKAVLPNDWIDRVCQSPDVSALLSKREQEVLRKLLEGKSRKQISEELFVTEATIRKHATSIYSKLNVRNRAELLYQMTQLVS